MEVGLLLGTGVTRQEVTLHRAKLGTNLGSPTYQAGGSGASHGFLACKMGRVSTLCIFLQLLFNCRDEGSDFSTHKRIHVNTKNKFIYMLMYTYVYVSFLVSY